MNTMKKGPTSEDYGRAQAAGRRRWVLLVTGTGASIFWASGSWAQAEAEALSVSGWWLGLTILVLLVIVGGLLVYMGYLQREFLRVCDQREELEYFVQSPAGLPPGTIRSMITLIMVIFSAYLFVLTMFKVGEFPQALGAVLSTIIGFYFGNRAATAAREKPAAETEMARAAQNKAISDRDQTKAQVILSKAKKVVHLAQTASGLFPEESRKKYSQTLEKLERGVKVADDLFSQGMTGAAAQKAQEVYEEFKKDNPLRETFLRAKDSFDRAAGSIAPPPAVVNTVVTIGTRLMGTQYAKWKARVLRTPFNPTQVPLKLMDADTGQTLILQSPVLKEAFQSKIAAQDRSFMKTVVKDMLTRDMERLWKDYGQYFESREEMETEVEEFRRAAADMELKQEFDPALFQETGGYKPFMKAIDAIQEDDEAQADLDRLMELVEGLQRADEPVKKIFDKVRQEVAS